VLELTVLGDDELARAARKKHVGCVKLHVLSFVDILSHPPFKGLFEEADATVGRLLQIVKRLISRLEEIRKALSLKPNFS
jgi:hypothetical protein